VSEIDATTDTELGLFQALGVELEYMIVDADTLSVRPIADELLREPSGEIVSEVEHGAIAWSNELVAHVIELKTNGPAATLEGLNEAFAGQVREIGRLLAAHGARLMPTAMHPWMDPHAETKLWPHDYSVVYQTFDRIFGCQGHGWSNLQCVHLNLPFAGDEQFGRLHAAIRMLLPLLPALAASSPICDGRPTGWLDTRLDVYRGNSRKIPSITGQVVPEPVFTRQDYDQQIFQQIYADISPLDPEGVLQHEWLNARGAIARFERGAIEIRVLDLQECPQADLAVCAAIITVLRELVAERWSSLAEQQAWPTEPLAELLAATAREGDAARIQDERYLRAFGFAGSPGSTAGQLWQHLLKHATDVLGPAAEPWQPAWNVIANQGPLARRILRAIDANPGSDRQRLESIYRRLCDCLQQNELFLFG
jgi:gamma-glutamyl:cysteine ligase YbdK (ATP-grasp superfamily)